MATAYALIDCNNFYASCERVFQLELKGRPLVILSNNDGCIIARSGEAKKLGVEMGTPEFKARPLIKKHDIAVRSSNYTLYGDMSNRVMETLRCCTPNVEVYSIDEAFAELSDWQGEAFSDVGLRIRRLILKRTGIPVSVGIASTKTLAKIANEYAKKHPGTNGVWVLDSEQKVQNLLAKTPVDEVWGIGRNYSVMLRRAGVETAADLRKQPDKWIRKKMKVTGLRTVLELRGESCLSLDERTEPRKGILTSRSFGKPVTNLEDMKEAVTAFTARAAEKLRAQHSVATRISVVLVSEKYRNPGSQYKFGLDVLLPNPSANTMLLSSAAGLCVQRLFDKNRKYKKAWVMLTGLIPDSEVQRDLFSGEEYSRQDYRLMESMDKINLRFGRGTMQTAGSGLQRSWSMKQQFLSKRFTTRWSDLMVVH